MSTILSKIVVVGAGNVGQALAKRLHEAGCQVQLLARHSLRELPQQAEIIHLYADIWPDADLYILAVGDRNIAQAAEELAQNAPLEALVVHTSGATPATVLTPYFARHGVLWPLQTFTTGHIPDFSTMPAIIFSSEDDQNLRHFAGQIFGRTVVMDDIARSKLHVAAVIVNNFTNHLCQLSTQVSGSDWRLLLPLLAETVAKLRIMSPQEAQTGPAIRGDEATISRHLALLSSEPATTKAVYQALTDSIQQTNNKDISR